MISGQGKEASAAGSFVQTVLFIFIKVALWQLVKQIIEWKIDENSLISTPSFPI